MVKCSSIEMCTMAGCVSFIPMIGKNMAPDFDIFAARQREQRETGRHETTLELERETEHEGERRATKHRVGREAQRRGTGRDGEHEAVHCGDRLR